MKTGKMWWLLWPIAAGCSTEQSAGLNDPNAALTPPQTIPSTASQGIATQPAGQLGAAPVQQGSSSTVVGALPGVAAGPTGDGFATPTTPTTPTLDAAPTPSAQGAAGSPSGEPAEQAAAGECGTPGLELEGLMYSPGGELLPFPCKPFDPTTNNPYAVRCIDAWPWYETDFAGDEYCILPPEPGKGIQIGVHPQGTAWYEQVSQGDLSGYENPSDEFLMDPGQEEERNYITSSPNQSLISFYRSYTRMRAGSHHMILSATPSGQAGRRETWNLGDAVAGLFGGVGLPGAQRPDENVPKTLDKPADDKGLYRDLGPNQDVIFNMHHFNSTDAVTLKEAWENLWFEEDRTIQMQGIFGMPLTQVVGTFATPGQTVDIHHRWDIGQEIRLLQLFGHRHVWTTNFSAWVEKPDGSQEILYQSFDWFDQPTYRYDSVTQNPLPASEKLLDGGASGVQILKPGDQLHFNCHMSFTDERAAEEGAPRPATIGSLRFANQAFEGEMCILFGSTAGIRLPSPVADGSPVPDFAAVD